MTTGRDASHADVIARLKEAAKGDAHAFDAMTVEDARGRLARSREIARTIETSLKAETARKRGLVEVFLSRGLSLPPPPPSEASASADASEEALARARAEGEENCGGGAGDADAEDADEGTIEGLKRALASSQARARVSLARARRTRAYADVLDAALNAAAQA